MNRVSQNIQKKKKEKKWKLKNLEQKTDEISFFFEKLEKKNYLKDCLFKYGKEKKNHVTFHVITLTKVPKSFLELIN